MDDTDKLLCSVRDGVLRSMGVEDGEDATGDRACSLYGDTPAEMTGGRLVARAWANCSNCYYTPKEGGPSLDLAWAHYEHMTLARIYSDEGVDPVTGKRKFVRAPFGEKDRPTELYPLWSTPTKQLADFGVSVRMYFSTLLTLSSFLFIAGILNLPLISFFMTDDYTTHENKDPLPVQGSSVCFDTVEVDCVDCEGHPSLTLPPMKNECDFEGFYWPGLLSWGASLLLLAQFGVAFFWLQRKAEIVFDEEIQTPSDYSIKISNPPADATDPTEWRDFLEQFGHVSYLTVAIDNAELVRKLLKHKKIRYKLSAKLPDTCDIWNAQDVEMTLQSMPRAVGKLWAQLQKLQEEIKVLLDGDYKAVAVYATFETERGQRNSLHALSSSKMRVWRNKLDMSRFDTEDESFSVKEQIESSQLPTGWKDFFMGSDQKEEELHIKINKMDGKRSLEENLLFRGEKVVKIKEAPEPMDIRWLDLQVPYGIRFVGFMGTTIAVLVFMSWSAFFISQLHKNPELPVFVLPMFIAVTNVLVPKICEFINKFESHSTDGSRQTSLYVKTALFRWFNSALALLLIYGFTNTISSTATKATISLNQMAFNLIFAEMFTIPIIKLCDFMGFIRKHILAPRAEDQDEMNSYFQGAKFELAERFTDASKVLFVSLFYSSILPASLFLGAIALIMHYAQAKFCLLRMWRPAPDLGFGLSRLSRNYFFSLALLIHVIMSAYWWSGYPFDNLCASENSDQYMFCNQDFLRSGVFPPLPRFQPDGQEWMGEGQATITSLYAWTAVVMIVIGGTLALKENILPYVESIFSSTYEPDGADQKIPFSEIKHLTEITAFVPQLREAAFGFPQLICDVSKIDHSGIGWKDDDDHSYLKHSLYHEAKLILGHEPKVGSFSRIMEWLVVKEEEKKEEPPKPSDEEEVANGDAAGYGTFHRMAAWMFPSSRKKRNTETVPLL